MEKAEIIEIAREKAKEWLNGAYDKNTKTEVTKLLDEKDTTNLVESFYGNLEFGTGGLRGIMGVGTNRMNIYTVGSATQGFANYINSCFKGEKSVCIGHDCRNNSIYYAKTVASIFSANGITAYLFNSLRPTPEISFAIRKLGCKGGVIITASHNPKEYNGYKAYWEDGSQLITPHDTNVINEVKKIKAEDIKFDKVEDKIKILDESFDLIFLEQIKTIQLSPEAIKTQHDLKIVFTPLHGTTYKLVPESLRYWGFTNITTIPEQMITDGNFPTVISANPEEPAAFKMALDKAKEIDADIAMACDPDGDRIGIAVKDDEGVWTLLNGNQTNIIFTYYILRRRQELGMIKGNEYTVKTIVTSELLKKIAEENKVKCYDVYTGFKWIAAVVRELGPDGYIGAGEESFGFMPGAYTRDKDAVSATSMMAEIAAWAKEQKITLFDLLKQIYKEYGFSQEKMIYIVRKGLSGAEEIKNIMTDFRENPPKEINGSKVILRKDYANLKESDLIHNTTKDMDFPITSNVLQYFLEDGSKISVRPSGTEPKIKFYYEVIDKLKDINDFKKVQELAYKKIDKIMASFKF